MFFLFALVLIASVQDLSAMKYVCNRTDLCGCSRKPVIAQRIIGGEPALQDTWSWTVSLRDNQGHFCGGSILNDRYVITAAHCLVESMDILSSITICAGTHRLSASCRQRREIKNVINHPSFNNRTYENDIALIRLKIPFHFTDTSIARICLPRSAYNNDYPKPETDVFAIGWGKTNTSVLPDILQQVRVRVVDRFKNNCDLILSNHRLQLCAAAAGKDACQGDSGGPLMVFTNLKRWELIGITSYGDGCATAYPGVYTRITAFLEWILQILNNRSPHTDRSTHRPTTTTFKTVTTTQRPPTTTIKTRTSDPYDRMIAILRSKATKKVLDSDGDKRVYPHNHNGGNFQKWIFKRQNNGTYVLQNIQTSFMLESNDKKLYTASSNGGSHQQWRIHRENDGSYVVKNLATSHVLDSTNDISMADSLHPNVSESQKWSIEQAGMNPSDGMIAFLRNKHTHKILDSNFAKRVYPHDYNGGNFQKWIFKQQNDGRYVLQNVHTSFALESSNETLCTANINGSTAQQWKFHEQHDGSYVLQNFATSRILESNGTSRTNSLNSDISDHQKWFLEPTAAEPYHSMIAVLRNKATKEVVDSNRNKDVYLHAYNGGNFQKWTFIRQENGAYALRNLETSFMLDANNEKVYTGGSNDSNHQKWRFHRQNDSSYVLQNLATSRVLHSANGIGNAGFLDSNVPDNQKWFLEDQ